MYWHHMSPLVPACWTADGLAKKSIEQCRAAGEAKKKALSLAKAKAHEAVKRELVLANRPAKMPFHRVVGVF